MFCSGGEKVVPRNCPKLDCVGGWYQMKCILVNYLNPVTLVQYKQKEAVVAWWCDSSWHKIELAREAFPSS